MLKKDWEISPKDSAITELIRTRFPLKKPTENHETKEKKPKLDKKTNVLKD